MLKGPNERTICLRVIDLHRVKNVHESLSWYSPINEKAVNVPMHHFNSEHTVADYGTPKVTHISSLNRGHRKRWPRRQPGSGSCQYVDMLREHRR